MEILACVAEYFYLDGGAMFGAVPKALWSAAIPADEKNRIRLACRVLYIRDGRRAVLIDLGCGSKYSEKQQRIYSFEHRLPEGLHRRFPDVTDVVLTHLHFDHCGGVSHLNDRGELQLSFPGAVHHVQERHWLHAQSPGPRERATFFKENLEPLKSASLRFSTSGDEILPSIRVYNADGHTPGLQWILIGSGKGAIAFASELVPTIHHLPLPYVMGYDLCAQTTLAEKAAFLERAIQEDWVVVFDHDPEVAAGRVGKSSDGRYMLTERVEIPELR